MTKLHVSVILMITFIWGYTWVIMKVGLEYLPPFLFSSLRLLIGAILLFLVQIIRKKPLLPKGDDWKSLLIMSLLMSIGFFGLSSYGLQFVSSGVGAILVYSMPIFVSVLAHFLLKESLTLTKGAGLCFGAIGLLFVMGQQILNQNLDKTLFGQLLIVLSAVCWACANIFSKKYLFHYDKIKMTFWQMLVGSLLLYILSVMTEPSILKVQWTIVSGSSLLFTGVFSTAVAIVAWFWVIDKMEVSIASLVLMLVPVLGLFFGWQQLDEKITNNIWIGAVFICLGIFFGSYKPKIEVRAKY